jgi:hypothetical protein
MKTFLKCLFMTVGIIVAVLLTFSAGVYFGPQIWIEPKPSVQRSETMIHVCPPPDGPLYSTDDYARANDAVYWFIQSELEKPEYDDLDLTYIVIPGYSGYATYTYSSSSKGFPRDLRLKVDEIFEHSLNDRQTEQVDDADRPATAVDSKTEDKEKTKPESEGRSQ